MGQARQQFHPFCGQVKFTWEADCNTRRRDRIDQNNVLDIIIVAIITIRCCLGEEGREVKVTPPAGIQVGGTFPVQIVTEPSVNNATEPKSHRHSLILHLCQLKYSALSSSSSISLCTFVNLSRRACMMLALCILEELTFVAIAGTCCQS